MDEVFGSIASDLAGSGTELGCASVPYGWCTF